MIFLCQLYKYSMKEEKIAENSQYTVKVQNILHLSPHINNQLYQRPIDIKIDEIRRRLQQMVRVKIKRSGSEQKLQQKSKDFNEMDRNITQLYNVLCPKNIVASNTLPIIKAEQKKVAKNDVKKMKLNADSYISKVKTQLNESLQNEKQNYDPENKNKPVHTLAAKSENTADPQHKNLLLTIEKIKSNKDHLLTKNSKQKLKLITTRNTQEINHEFQKKDPKIFVRTPTSHSNKNKNRKILSQPNIYQKAISTAIRPDIGKKFIDNKREQKKQPILHNKRKKNSLKIIQSTTTHKDFANFISQCNRFYIQQQGPFSFYIGKGNNPQIIRRALKKRGWIQANLIEQANFVWTQKKNQFFFQSLKKIQLIEEQAKLSKIRSTFYFSNKGYENLSELTSLPFSKFVGENTIKLLSQESSLIGQQGLKKNFKHKISFKNQIIMTYKDKQFVRIHNHFANHHQLAYKQALFWNLKKYYEQKNLDPFLRIPMTFHIRELNDIQWNRFKETYDQIKQESPLWIVKPAENTNRGNGICVKDSIEEVRSLIEQRKMEKPDSGFIVQKYLMPLLYNKRKFDIRCYLLVTVVNGYLRAYWYEQGYCRTASKVFNPKNLKNKYIHLTNDAIQKNCTQYGKFQPANKLSFADLSKYIEKTQSQFSFQQKIYPQMVSLAKDSIASTCHKIWKSEQNFCFQIFGLDYMIDEKGKVWLIEVNRNPCLETSTSLLCRIISNMIDDAFEIALDPIFPVNMDDSKGSRTPNSDAFQSNLFKLIHEESLIATYNSA